MELLRSWLLGVIAASLLTAVADSLMPEGAVKQTGKLACGLVVLFAVLSPLMRLDPHQMEEWLEDYAITQEEQKTQLAQQRSEQMKTVMEERFAAYISDKTEALGAVCRVRVECEAQEPDVFLPVRAELTGNWDPEIRAQLERLLEEDLGIPLKQQSYTEEGAS